MTTKTKWWLHAVAVLAIGACGGDSNNNGEPDGGTTPDGGLGQDGGGPGPDGSTGDGGLDPDAAPDPVMSITEVIPPAASRGVNTEVTVLGFNIEAGATVTIENCDSQTVYDLSGAATAAQNGLSIDTTLAADITREQGLYTVTVTNLDGGTDSLLCAFRILAAAPPTVTDVSPDTSFTGVPGDGVNSDTIVTVSGTGFQATPRLRWIKTDNSVSYDALFVGFVSDTQLTAVVPSETLSMDPGEYNVLAINPDLLSAFWDIGTPEAPDRGIFEVTSAPPPSITEVTPARVINSECIGSTLTVTGGNFDPLATVWWRASDPGQCAANPNTRLDSSGNTLCGITVSNVIDTENLEITFGTDECPPDGPFPVVVFNPDEQSDTFFNIEIRPNANGHLESGPFTVLATELLTARFKHVLDFAFDNFGNSFLYAMGGQNANGEVLDSVEVAQMDIFGNVGAFAEVQQYDANSETRRSVNGWITPRAGAALSRLGDLFVVTGGSSSANDVQDSVASLNTVETAQVLGFEQMPGIQLPQQVAPGQGLPFGSYYYQVSAVDTTRWGEGLPTREVVAIDTTGELRVCWSDPASDGGTTTYNVFRSLAPDGRANSAAAIAFEVTGNCFTDTGRDEHTPGPGSLRGSSATGTGLAAGTHRYRVSADIELSNNGGTFETYASYTSAIELTDEELAAGDAAIALAWNAVDNATGYRVFREDPNTGEFLMLVGGEVTGTTFTDDGAAFDESAREPRFEIRPLGLGSLSLWRDTTVPNMNSVREGHESVAIAMDPDAQAGLRGRILVTGGRVDNQENATLTSSESIGILADGSFENAWFNEPVNLNSGRVYYSLLTTQGSQGTPFPPPPGEPPCSDLDGDTFLPCSCAPEGTPVEELDCDDTDPNIHPGAEEICGDGIDQDCDLGCTGTDEECACTDDDDSDGFLSLTCGGADCCDDGSETDSPGCNLERADSIYPGAPDQCGDGIDQDCDGFDNECNCDTDADGDGFVSIECGGSDCCDVGTDNSMGCTNATAGSINPDAFDFCQNGIDEDCTGGEPFCIFTPDEPRPRANPTRPVATGVATSTSRINRWWDLGVSADPTPVAAFPTSQLPVATQVLGDDPVYAVAVFGDDAWAFNNTGSLQTTEACLIDELTGLLACDTVWTAQTNADSPQDSFAMDALLYFDTLYPFYGLNSERVDVSNNITRAMQNAATQRYQVADVGTLVDEALLIGQNQSSSAAPDIGRAYYKAVRLLAHVYVVGGWVDDSDGSGTPGPTATVERQQQ